MDRVLSEYVGQSISLEMIQHSEELMTYRNLLPQPQIIQYREGTCSLKGPVVIRCAYQNIAKFAAVAFVQHAGRETGTEVRTDRSFVLTVGKAELTAGDSIPKQGYVLSIQSEGIALQGGDEQGLFYGVMTLEQILAETGGVELRCAEITDAPVLEHRGVMLDLSRGRVYTLEFLKDLVVKLAQMKMNVLQLYIEHTFAFPSFPEFWKGSDPITPDEIRELDQWCSAHFVELQPNLQSFGHCRRILTTKRFRHLSESTLYWTLSPAESETYSLIDTMYGEFLPLFSSNRLNVCSDETYDIGNGKSAALAAELGKGRLYLSHILRLRSAAAVHGKKIMVFGDVILKYPELISELPDDIIFIDWIYDPKDSYETPKMFGEAGKPFWVCPGTGSWNSLFPRQEGALKNIAEFTMEGIKNGAQGMLLADWGDHGCYSMPVTVLFSYAAAASVSWTGKKNIIDEQVSRMLQEPSYASLQKLLASIYRIPPLWSKNRSQCVIALFDEPLTGKSITGCEVPDDLMPYQELPDGIVGVLDPESHHLMRPLFQLSEAVLSEIGEKAREARNILPDISHAPWRDQYRWIIDAFDLLAEKVRFCRSVRNGFTSASVSEDLMLDWENTLRGIIGSYTDLQIRYISIWHSFAKTSEIQIVNSYFAHIIERMDYLSRWIASQRNAMEQRIEPDYALASYETVGYRSLPTY